MLIIGLGNPDKKYENTYHNVGFMVIDNLLSKLNLKATAKECKSLVSVSYVNGQKLIIAKPQTYMNLSGEAVRELIGKYKQSDEDILIIYDDIDLPLGNIRVRKEGSAGTHNGMRNIIALTDKKLPRIRIGIGKPLPPMSLVDYVLSKITGDNKAVLDKSVDKTTDIVIQYIRNKDFEMLMRNSKWQSEGL